MLRLTEPRSGHKPGHDAIRANLDLPDFFANLAGNHGKKTNRGRVALIAIPITSQLAAVPTLERVVGGVPILQDCFPFWQRTVP